MLATALLLAFSLTADPTYNKAESFAVLFYEVCFIPRKFPAPIGVPDEYYRKYDEISCTLGVHNDIGDIDGISVRTALRQHFNLIYIGYNSIPNRHQHNYRFVDMTGRLTVHVLNIGTTNNIEIIWNRY